MQNHCTGVQQARKQPLDMASSIRYVRLDLNPLLNCVRKVSNCRQKSIQVPWDALSCKLLKILNLNGTHSRTVSILTQLECLCAEKPFMWCLNPQMRRHSIYFKSMTCNKQVWLIHKDDRDKEAYLP